MKLDTFREVVGRTEFVAGHKLKKKQRMEGRSSDIY